MAVVTGPVQGEWRPHGNLMAYYVLESLLLGPFFPLLLIPRLLRFRTLIYRFDDEGVSMRWGALFRREASLSYERIQDIHLTSNLVQRWLGLGVVQLQTASGTASAEVTIEGLQNHEQVRDFLYRRMRGIERSAAAAPEPEPQGDDELVRALRDVCAELRALRRELADRPGTAGR